MTGPRGGILSSPQALGAGLITLAAVGFGTLGPLARYADQADVTSLAMVTWRAGVGAALMVGFLLLRSATGHRPAQRWSGLPGRDRRFVSGGGPPHAAPTPEGVA